MFLKVQSLNEASMVVTGSTAKWLSSARRQIVRQCSNGKQAKSRFSDYRVLVIHTDGNLTVRAHSERHEKCVQLRGYTLTWRTASGASALASAGTKKLFLH